MVGLGMLEAGSQELGWALRGDGHQVFAADAKFVGDVDARLVGKSHVGFENGGKSAQLSTANFEL